MRAPHLDDGDHQRADQQTARQIDHECAERKPAMRFQAVHRRLVAVPRLPVRRPTAITATTSHRRWPLGMRVRWPSVPPTLHVPCWIMAAPYLSSVGTVGDPHAAVVCEPHRRHEQTTHPAAVADAGLPGSPVWFPRNRGGFLMPLLG